jgi:hypothetical protein
MVAGGKLVSFCPYIAMGLFFNVEGYMFGYGILQEKMCSYWNSIRNVIGDPKQLKYYELYDFWNVN